MVSPENLHRSKILQPEQIFLFRKIYVYACTSKHPLAIKEERGHEFEREQGGWVGRA